jgi:cell division protein ZipA
MTPLQWALLILGVAAVVAVYWFSRRDRAAMNKWNPEQRTEPLLPPAVQERQLDIFKTGSQQFDEFGVGKPRPVPPELEPEVQAQGPVAAPLAHPPVEEKIVSLLIAEREGTHIQGRLIHRALSEAGLSYGARSVYHRLQGEHSVFCVASLLKPGILDPAQSEEFSTPGLTMFMLLPGPSKPNEALRDMLGTADKLAKALNAEVFDARRKPLTAAGARELVADVDNWARANAVA